VSTLALPLRRPARRSGALALGVATLWLSVIVLLPLAAVAVRAIDGSFWDVVTSRQAVAALRFTLLVSLATAAINAMTGTLIAWVLVRDRFPGKGALKVRVELELGDAGSVTAQLTRDQAELLELTERDVVWLRANGKVPVSA
jgi:ABC-type sulfate transport system permease subunit